MVLEENSDLHSLRSIFYPLNETELPYPTTAIEATRITSDGTIPMLRTAEKVPVESP